MKKLVILLTALAMTSCIKEGVIVEKAYEIETEYVTFLPIAMYNGKTTTTVFIPYLIHDNEDFVIKIKGVNKRGKVRYSTLYINKDQLDTLMIGDYLCIDKDCLSDNNNIQTKQ